MTTTTSEEITMGQVSVTTSTTTLDSGTSGYVVLRNLGQVHVTVSVGAISAVLLPACGMTLSPNGVAVTARTPSGTALVDVATQPAPDSLQARSAAGVQSRVSGAGLFVTRATAPALADLAVGEVALAVDGSGNLKVYSNVAGVLKVGTVTVS